MSAQGSQVYSLPKDRLFEAILQAVQQLEYMIQQQDRAAGTVSFNTGMSIWSWNGQDMTAVISEEGSQCRVSLSGGVARRGISVATLTSWGETERVAQAFFARLNIVVAQAGGAPAQRHAAPSAPRHAPAAAQPAVPAGGGGGGSTVDQLERLAALHANGTLTDEEFRAAKAKLING